MYLAWHVAPASANWRGLRRPGCSGNQPDRTAIDSHARRNPYSLGGGTGGQLGDALVGQVQGVPGVAGAPPLADEKPGRAGDRVPLGLLGFRARDAGFYDALQGVGSLRIVGGEADADAAGVR